MDGMGDSWSSRSASPFPACSALWPTLRGLALTGLAVLAVGVGPSSAQNEPTTIFVSVGSMNEARYLHAAASLASGDVLVTGGANQGGAGGLVTRYRASAEVYDLSARAFKLTDSMSIRRVGHTATTLADGTVLIVGGVSTRCTGCDDEVVARAERYDPARKKFFPTGSLIAARADHAATLLADGRVLITGGRDLTSPLASAELYDPASGTFSQAGSMVHARALGHTATLLQDGRVLIVGGLVAAEVYDPAIDLFHEVGGGGPHVPAGRTATLLLDGRVLIAGGFTLDPGIIARAEAELYDPHSETFVATGGLVTPRGGHGATLLADGRVLLAGGYGGPSSGYLATVELYDPATGQFGLAGVMTAPRAAHVQLAVGAGDVLVVGGVDGSSAITATAELFQP
jgi:Galactose oxidase, central domain